MKVKCLIFLLVVLLHSVSAQSEEKLLRIYHDADYSINQSSAQAMKMGMLTALDEVDNQVNGYRIELLEKDHRGNIRRSKHNIAQFIKDPQALFVLGGLHSPPYIKNLAYINDNKVPLLVPWAAGGPITRYNGQDNTVFRLSVDDSVAGSRISQFAIENKQCQSPHLLLENTPWGKSNENTMSSYLDGKVPFNISWFEWNIKASAAKVLLRNAIAEGADCFLLVANYPESKVFLNAMLTFEAKDRKPFVSHWGLTGGNTEELMTDKVRNNTDLSFIQSCFSFYNNSDDKVKEVVKRAKRQFPQAFIAPESLLSPAGFVHAYDLGKLAVEAMSQIAMSGDITQDRAAFILALENISKPIQGLIKVYQTPFSDWTEQNVNGHEALGLQDFCMASYGDKNEIRIVPN